MGKRGSVAVLLLLGITTFCWGFVSSHHLGNEQGLSQNSVLSITQDQHGFIWIATNDGLNRYDGYSFSVFNVPEFDTAGFQCNDYSSVMQSTDGRIWFGTQAAVYSYDPVIGQIQPIRFRSTAANPKGERIIVRGLLQRKNQQIWVASKTSVFQITDSLQLAEIVVNQPANETEMVRFKSIFEDSNETLWLTASNGLYVFNDRDGAFYPVKINNGQTYSILNAVQTDREKLLLCTENGLLLFNTKTGNIEYPALNGLFSNTKINKAFDNKEGEIWVATESKGLFQVDRSLSKVIGAYHVGNDLIKSNHINTVFHDNTGLVWVGTSDKGVFVLNLAEQMMQKIEAKGLLAGGITSLAAVEGAKDMLWAGTVENGVVTVDYSNSEKPVIFHPKGIVPPKLSSQKITSLLPTPGQLAVATGDQELYLIETNGTNWKRFGVVKGIGRKQEISLGKIANLTLGADGNIYFSSDMHSACVYDQTSKSVMPIKLPHARTSSETDLGTGALHVSTIACDSNGDLWFGTFGNGLFKMEYGKEGYAKIIAIKDGHLSKIFISSLLCHQGNLWIGTKSKGLYFLGKGAETIQNIDPNNQLASKVINAILPDANNDIWISTNKGIAKYDTKEGNFVNYTGTNYLQGYEFGLNAAMANQSDYLFFAGQGGINFFKPTDAKATHAAPEVIISELLINNQSIKPGLTYNDRVVLQRSIEMTNRIVLSHKDKVVGFLVSPVHYYDSKNNIFFYKLEPYEKDWIKRDMSNRFVTYNNLKGGTYTLKVKAQSSEGIFSDEKSIVIKINPPLWQRTWFVVLAYIVVFGLVGMIFGIYLYNQKQREHQLEHEKNMMQSLIDNIPDYICFKNLQSRFTRVNIAQAKLLGLNDPRQAVGKSDFDFFDHAEESYQIEQQIIKTGVPVINQLRTLVIDGIPKYISDTKIALYDKDKKCIGTVGVSRDISELKLAENAMLESQAKFKALFDNAPLAIFRIDNKQRIVEYNYRFSTMFGYSKSDDLTVLTTSDLLVDPDLGNLIFETVLETKEVNAEINLKRKDGATFIANLTLALLEEGFNDITIEGIIEDITQMAFARDEIIKAKDKAIEADRLKSLFLANMSHEIRTPMNAIIGFSNMLREDKLTNEDRNYFIDVIQSNGNNLVSLIDSIVDFSKLEADQMSVSLGEFNIHPLIESVIDHTEKSLISEGKGHIRVAKGAFSDKHIRIVSDRHRLNQVLLHLVSNAIKFTDEGEIEIGYLQENNSIKIFVRDTGIGIDKEKHDYIFQRFTKIEDKNKLYGGTGLGLTISKGLIELMGGSIHVDSDTGKGSTFTIILPIQEKIT